MGKKKVWWKRKSFILGIILIGIAGYSGYVYFFDTTGSSDSTTNNYIYTSTPITVGTGDISETISFDGTTSFYNAQKLTFGKNGLKVKAVYVNVGDEVKDGDILATLQTSSLDEQLESAQISIKQAKIDYEEKLSNTNNELDLLKAKSDLKTAQSNLENIESTITLANNEEDTQIEKKQVDYDEAVENYNELLEETKNGINDSERKYKNTYTSAIDDLKDATIDIQNSLDEIDRIMYYTSSFGEKGTSSVYIGAKNSSLKTTTKNLFFKVLSANEDLEEIYDTLAQENDSDGITQSQVEGAYDNLKTLAINVMDLGETASDMFNASVTSSDLSQSEISNYVNTANSIYTQGRKLKDQATTTMDSIYDLDLDTEQDLADAKEKMDNLKNELDSLLLSKSKRTASNQEKRVNAQEAVEDAQQAIDNINDGYTNISLQNAKDSVTKAQLSVNSKLQEYEDYQLIANFDGTVTEMDIQEGDTISNDNSDDTYIYVEDPNLIEIELEVEQTDILKLYVGDPVTITLDVFDGQTFTGKFSEISTVPTTSNGTSTYKTKVLFEKPADVNILGGMTATVTTIVSESKNVILVPNSALTLENGKYYVTGEDGTRQEVEIGESDDENTEITSGLSVGDTILGLSITQNDLSTSGISDDQSDSGGFGGGPGGGGAPSGGGGPGPQ